MDMRVQLEIDGVTDRHKKMQSTLMPSIDASFVEAYIEQLWEFTEENG